MVAPSPGKIGERLLPSVVDHLAAAEPDKILFSFTKTKNPADGFQDVSAKEFSRAVDRCSWYLEDKLGYGKDFPTLLYMGPQDLMYGILVLATIKTGHKLLLTSPRNTLEAHLYLLQETDCHTFLVPQNFPLPIVKEIQDARKLHTVDIAPLSYWLEDAPHKLYPYTKTFTEARQEPFAVLHTSGSTGMPKPIVQSHETWTSLDLQSTLPALGHPVPYPYLCKGSRVYNVFPLFHSGGLSILLPASLYCGFTVVLAPFPPSADVANAVHVHGNLQQVCIPPMILMELAKNPEHVENLSKLDQVGYGGGPLPEAVGELISSKVRLVNGYGSTECGTIPMQLCARNDWKSISINKILGHEFRPVSDDLYEFVIVKKPELLKYQGIFGTFPELDEWPTKDLFSKHPTEENTWLFQGRRDDIVVFSNGEKFNPLDMESTIGAHPLISGVIVVGLGRTQASLLVETTKPVTSNTEKEERIDAIWDTVQKANREAASHGRIHRDHIIFVSADKPFPRAGKGTIQRRIALDLYKTELDDLYRDTEAKIVSNGFPGDIVQLNDDNVQQQVRMIVSESSGLQQTQLSDNTDYFELGVDSLQVTLIVKELNKSLAAAGIKQTIETQTVYSNPTTSALSAALSNLLHGNDSNNRETDEDKMKNLLATYAANMPISGRRPLPKSSTDSVVLLTGSTGSLGSYLLDSLIRNKDVSHIYCLIRGKDGLERQTASQASKGLQPLPEKVTCLHSSLAEPLFGLSSQQYRHILQQTTHIIHNAWKVDFNMSISSFTNQIATVRRFIDFSAHSTYGAKIVFISSVSAVGGVSGSVSEEIYRDWTTPLNIGYGQSKFIAECLLDEAAKEADTPAAIIRVGQIAGPTTQAGEWPKKEWIPSLIASSKYLGALPESLGANDDVDWVPVDILGNGIVEMTLNPVGFNVGAATIYHVSNPNTVKWATLLPVIAKYLNPDDALNVMPYSDWVKQLESSAYNGTDLALNPAVKLINFFQGLSDKLEVTQALSASPSLADLQPIGEKDMENWLRQWDF